jgi:hypothetical protein
MKHVDDAELWFDPGSPGIAPRQRRLWRESEAYRVHSPGIRLFLSFLPWGNAK